MVWRESRVDLDPQVLEVLMVCQVEKERWVSPAPPDQVEIRVVRLFPDHPESLESGVQMDFLDFPEHQVRLDSLGREAGRADEVSVDPALRDYQAIADRTDFPVGSEIPDPRVTTACRDFQETKVQRERMENPEFQDVLGLPGPQRKKATPEGLGLRGRRVARVSPDSRGARADPAQSE